MKVTVERRGRRDMRVALRYHATPASLNWPADSAILILLKHFVTNSPEYSQRKRSMYSLSQITQLVLAQKISPRLVQDTPSASLCLCHDVAHFFLHAARASSFMVDTLDLRVRTCSVPSYPSIRLRAG